MRSYLSLSVFALSMAAAATACSGGSGDTGSSSGDTTSSSSGSEPSASSSTSSSGASGASSGGSSSGASSGTGSSSGTPIDPGKPGAACDSADDCDDRVCTDETCRAATATDGVKNGNESGIDCGQSGTGANTSAPACATDGACTVPADCLNAVCTEAKCAAPTATDGVKNGNETGIDCGSSAVGQETSAPKCADTLTCGVAADCTSGVCNVTCQVPTSSDTVKNGNETDVDCGSLPIEGDMVDTDAAPCADLAACAAELDCVSQVCTDAICQAPTCTDGKKNGTETDLNCGGVACAACADLKACLLVTDCASGVCTGNVCQVPTKLDGVKNGNETDVDCGASGVGFDTDAPVCRNAHACTVNGDCFSGKCTGNVCQVPTKLDGVKNGNETDVDCGTGPIVPDAFYGATTDTQANACADLAACLGADDCVSLVCTTAVCQVPTFTDGVKNGTETDQDCGGGGARGAGTGPQANRCIADKICVEDEDCKSNACKAGRCLLARSCDMHHGGDTCGTGDETFPVAANGAEPAPYSIFKKHESCCTSIPINGPSGRVYLDKYQITAGRMRRFIETLANGANLDNANVKAWIDAVARNGNDKIMATAQLPAAWDNMFPTGWNTPTAPAENNCGQDAATPCNYGWVAHLGGFRYNRDEPGGPGGYGCQIDTGAHGSRTFYLPDAAAGSVNKYRDFNGEIQHRVSKDRLDQKSLDCVDQIMLAAFCAWDGGRLETKEEHAFAYGNGTFPWDPSGGPAEAIRPAGFTGPNSGAATGTGILAGSNATPANLNRFAYANFYWDYSNFIINDRWWFVAGRAQRTLTNLESLANDALGDDETPVIAPPGRYPAGAGPYGHRDLAGNMMEITSDGRWSKNGSFEGSAHSSLDSGGYNGFQFSARAKYGRAGGRCVRPDGGYPAQLIPKR